MHLLARRQGAEKVIYAPGQNLRTFFWTPTTSAICATFQTSSSPRLNR